MYLYDRVHFGLHRSCSSSVVSFTVFPLRLLLAYGIVECSSKRTPDKDGSSWPPLECVANSVDVVSKLGRYLRLLCVPRLRGRRQVVTALSVPRSPPRSDVKVARLHATYRDCLADQALTGARSKHVSSRVYLSLDPNTIGIHLNLYPFLPLCCPWTI